MSSASLKNKTIGMNTVEEKNELQLSSPNSLIAIALEKGTNMDQLERLLALKERWDAAQANKSFLSALSKFQRDVPSIPKKTQVKYESKTGGRVNYFFAELGDIDEAIKSCMAENGLSKRWEISEDGDRIICTCIISHIDGHQEKTTMSSTKDTSGGKNEIQSRASAISYMQRYTLIGALGLTTASEDNDAAGTDLKNESVKQGNEADTRPWLTEDQFQEAITRIKKGEESVLEKLTSDFRMKKAYREVLQNTKADDNQKTIPGHWYAKLEKCKTMDDILKLYNDNRLTVEANEELKNLFAERRDQIKKKHDSN